MAAAEEPRQQPGAQGGRGSSQGVAAAAGATAEVAASARPSTGDVPEPHSQIMVALARIEERLRRIELVVQQWSSDA